MIRIGLLDTTVVGAPGSMKRYREQLSDSLKEFAGDDLQVTTEYLGCDEETLDRTPARVRMWRRHYHIWKAARRLDVSRYDVLHVLDGSFGYVGNALRTNRVAVTVHDVIPRLQMDGQFPDAPPVGFGARWLIQKSLRGIGRAQVACADSQSTADDLKRLRLEPVKGVRVVPLAIDSDLFSGEKVKPQDVGVGGPYIFHLGNNGFYKNRVGVVELFNRIDPALQTRLVLAGPAPDERLEQMCRRSRYSDRIQIVSNPSQQELRRLYRAASLFVFPSHYEGFGWPPLEAMAAGCPVVSSDCGSLPEVVGAGGIVVSGGDYDAMAQACDKLLSDKTLREEMVVAGKMHLQRFTRKGLADAMLSVYQDVASVDP